MYLFHKLEIADLITSKRGSEIFRKVFECLERLTKVCIWDVVHNVEKGHGGASKLVCLICEPHIFGADDFLFVFVLCFVAK